MKNNKPFSNAKTVTLLSSHGFLVESVERILGGIKHRRDLYRMFDVLAMKPVEGVICIQCTTKAHLASHRQALLDNPDLIVCLKSGARCQIWSWRKVKRHLQRPVWEPRVEEAFMNAAGKVEFDRVKHLPETGEDDLMAA